METMTTGPRISLLRRFCQQDPDETKKAVKKLCEKNGGLVEDRNHIIHGTWAIEWDCATGICRVACIYEKNKRDPIPAERLKELSDRAAKFSNALGCLLEKMNPLLSGDRPRRFFFGKGGQEGHPPPPWPPEQQQ